MTGKANKKGRRPDEYEEKKGFFAGLSAAGDPILQLIARKVWEYQW
jgi:hypothetical protein